MRAIRFHALGGPDVLRLETIDDPRPGPGEVLLRVGAAGVNFADTVFTRGEYFYRPRLPAIPGMECAGEVIALGEGVESLAIGARVMAFAPGAYAELAVAKADECFPLPDGLDYAVAAALPVQGLTAHHLLTLCSRTRAGETVLVHAAAGGVGSLAVQLAKSLGARVIATAGSDDKLDLARSLGADLAINYRTEKVSERVNAATGGAGADVILEMLGGQAAIDDNLACLAAFGRLVVYGAASGDNTAKLGSSVLMKKNHTVTGYWLTPLLKRRDLCAPPLADLAARAAAGTLKVLVGARYALGDAAEAHRAIAGRSTTGKLVLLP